MLAALISLATGLGVPARLAKPVLAVVGAILLLGVLWGSKCAYDKRVIANHEAKQEAATAKADRKADAKAAEQRRTDDSRSTAEATEIKETIDEAKRTGANPRAAYYECVRKQQLARRTHKPSPDC
jgi:uncharacterized membrane protein YhiD involved in acid resistance